MIQHGESNVIETTGIIKEQHLFSKSLVVHTEINKFHHQLVTSYFDYFLTEYGNHYNNLCNNLM